MRRGMVAQFQQEAREEQAHGRLSACRFGPTSASIAKRINLCDIEP
jgi:hypothetical protein